MSKVETCCMEQGNHVVRTLNANNIGNSRKTNTKIRVSREEEEFSFLLSTKDCGCEKPFWGIEKWLEA